MPETPFGYFPDYDVKWDYKIGQRYKTQIEETINGIEQRRILFPEAADYGTGHKGGYTICTTTSHDFTIEQRKVIADFLDAAGGSFRAFYLFRKDRDDFVNYDCGTVTNQSSYIIPFKDSTVTSVTVANVSKAFTVTSNIGTGGEDRVNFTAGLQTGVVRVTLRGRERIIVRSLNDDVIAAFVSDRVAQLAVYTLAFRQVR
jgi:hypothetical protein